MKLSGCQSLHDSLGTTPSSMIVKVLAPRLSVKRNRQLYRILILWSRSRVMEMLIQRQWPMYHCIHSVILFSLSAIVDIIKDRGRKLMRSSIYDRDRATWKCWFSDSRVTLDWTTRNVIIIIIIISVNTPINVYKKYQIRSWHRNFISIWVI